MKKIARRAILLTLSFGISVAAFAAPTYIPVVNGQFSTGQYYFEGTNSALGGNVGLAFIPAIRYSNKFSLIPTFETMYRGTRSAEELAGGSTLFQDTWENNINVKAVHGLNQNWKLREKVGYRFKWFRETTDENWTDGLYDYHIISAGTELERSWGKKTSIAAGYELSFLKFPNYVSLESTQGDLAREFSGGDVLDTTIHLFSLRGQTPLFWSMNANVQGYLSPRHYNDQHIVVLSGLLTSEKRKDQYTGATFGLERLFKTSANTNLVSNVSYGYTALDSNQNHYDARVTEFIPDFYDYTQQRVALQFTLAVGMQAAPPLFFDIGGSYSRRNYDKRVIQAVDGNYMDEKLHQIETALNLGFSYPLSKNFRARVTSTFGRSKSNNDYEAVYRYNYTNSNYQFGFTYEY